MEQFPRQEKHFPIGWNNFLVKKKTFLLVWILDGCGIKQFSMVWTNFSTCSRRWETRILIGWNNFLWIKHFAIGWNSFPRHSVTKKINFRDSCALRLALVSKLLWWNNNNNNLCSKILTANSTMSASTMLPTTVMKSNVFQASLK